MQKIKKIFSCFKSKLTSKENNKSNEINDTTNLALSKTNIIENLSLKQDLITSSSQIQERFEKSSP